MKDCESCGEVAPRRKCSRCGRMVCRDCAAWHGSSRSSYRGAVIGAECYNDEECAAAQGLDVEA